MAKLIDITGQRFGRLVVLGKDPVNYKRTTLHPYGIKAEACMSRWICKCDCGAVKSVLGINLKGGRTQSCGCLRREFSTERLREVGKRNRRAENDGRGVFVSSDRT